MDALAQTEYISAGANRHSAASDWSADSGVLAYGADRNIALWQPLDDEARGVFTLLRGHKAKVTAVHFSTVGDDTSDELLISGSADGEVRLWRAPTGSPWKCEYASKAHEGAVNCVAALGRSGFFATGGADATIKLWRYNDNSLTEAGRISTKPRFIPLSLALGSFTKQIPAPSAFLIAAGTRNDIQVYGIDKLSGELEISHSATLTGHEGWIRCLALRRLERGGFILASTSADKYVRLWNFKDDNSASNGTVIGKADVAASESGLTAKVQKVAVGKEILSITFEALLLGHEDWVYSAAWSPQSNQQLLTASADGSLTIWEPDPSSGVWVSITRLGEISGQKGATTATGSAGGFWNALWSPTGDAVTCLGRTGSWRLWQFDGQQQYWAQRSAVTGHVNSVNGISWAPDGSYLLSTGSDQTTRLHAEWRRGTKRTWHEFARPQIHGYDLNCVSTTTSTQFASGADEKLLRVFDEPRSTARLLARLCNIEESGQKELPATAAIPVLGLSNKAMDATDGDAQQNEGTEQASAPDLDADVDQLVEPPSEDLLARHTLWPEFEKLYGHGYEISESASNGRILATACKASSLDHAVIRLYDTTSWNEIRPPLAAHTLTATRLAWAARPHNLLLSVGRDRQWAVFTQPSDEQGWQLLQSNPKAHSRMILDAAWSTAENAPFFATAGRDRCVKLWARSQSQPGAGFSALQTITRKMAVTAVAVTATSDPRYCCVAAGEDDGTVSLHVVDLAQSLAIVRSATIPDQDCPSGTVNRLSWRPEAERFAEDGPGMLLAIASSDSSVRILRIDLNSLLSGREFMNAAR